MVSLRRIYDTVNNDAKKVMPRIKMIRMLGIFRMVLRIFLLILLSSRLSSNGPAGACGPAAQSPVMR